MTCIHAIIRSKIGFFCKRTHSYHQKYSDRQKEFHSVPLQHFSSAHLSSNLQSSISFPPRYGTYPRRPVNAIFLPPVKKLAITEGIFNISTDPFTILFKKRESKHVNAIKEQKSVRNRKEKFRPLPVNLPCKD